MRDDQEFFDSYLPDRFQYTPIEVVSQRDHPGRANVRPKAAPAASGFVVGAKYEICADVYEAQGQGDHQLAHSRFYIHSASSTSTKR